MLVQLSRIQASCTHNIPMLPGSLSRCLFFRLGCRYVGYCTVFLCWLPDLKIFVGLLHGFVLRTLELYSKQTKYIASIDLKESTHTVSNTIMPIKYRLTSPTNRCSRWKSPTNHNPLFESRGFWQAYIRRLVEDNDPS